MELRNRLAKESAATAQAARQSTDQFLAILHGSSYAGLESAAQRLSPTTPYAASKAAASVMSTSFARSEGIRLAYLRIFNAFGEGQYSQNLWPAMRIAALSGQDFPLTEGNQIRDFVTVENVAHSFLSVLASTDIAPSCPLIANVGSGRPQTIREFCEIWWKYWRASGKLRFGEIPYRENEVMRFVPEIDHDLFK